MTDNPAEYYRHLAMDMCHCVGNEGTHHDSFVEPDDIVGFRGFCVIDLWTNHPELPHRVVLVLYSNGEEFYESDPGRDLPEELILLRQVLARAGLIELGSSVYSECLPPDPDLDEEEACYTIGYTYALVVAADGSSGQDDSAEDLLQAAVQILSTRDN